MECLVDEAAASHEQKHTEADLRAQQSVAASTTGLFWIGIISFITGGIGLALLYENLRMVQAQIAIDRQAATDEAERLHAQLDKMDQANDIVRKNAWDQARAYVSVGSYVAVRDGANCFSFEMVNRGQTPARGIKVYFEIETPPNPDLPTLTEIITPTDGLVHSTFDLGKDQPHLITAPNDASGSRRVRMSRPMPRSEPTKFMLNVRYGDVFGRFYEILVECDFTRILGPNHVLETQNLTSTEVQIEEAVYAGDPPPKE